MSDKLYLDAQQLLEDSFRLGAMILNSGFKPTFILAIWRGGSPVGVAVQELLAFHGIESNHIALRTSSYQGINQQDNTVKIYSMNYVVKTITSDDRLLIVDDVYDTGKSIKAIISELQFRARLNTPRDIRIAVPYFKPANNKTDRVPDFYIHETTQWLKFPHSLEGLTEQEVKKYRPNLHKIIAGANGRRASG